MAPLPAHVQPLFWDVAPDRIDPIQDREFVAGRVLSSGDFQSLLWLRAALGDAAILAYLERTRGRLLSARQLRFWELILDIPRSVIDGWLAGEARSLWERRAG